MARKLRQLIINRVDLVDAGANPGADVVIFKREDDNPKEASVPEEPEAVVEKVDETPPPELVPEPTELTEEVVKSLPAVVRQKLEEQETEIRKHREDSLRARAEAETERERRQQAELVKRASEELGHLPGTDEDKAKVLKGLVGLAEEVQQLAVQLLHAGDAACASLMQEKGDSQTTVETVDDEVRRMAKTLVTNGEAKTIEQATELVFQRSPALYERRRSENRTT